jgi:hypothetical protein
MVIYSRGADALYEESSRVEDRLGIDLWNVRNESPTVLLEGTEWRKVFRGEGMPQPTDPQKSTALLAKKKDPEAYRPH